MKVIFRISWTCCCILATLCTMTWQLSNYYIGKEQQIVEYRNFNELKTDVYPSLGLCWTMTIDETNLKQYGDTFSSRGYVDFLSGGIFQEDFIWDENMLAVEYYNVTPHFADYVLKYGYFT